jgi:CheY-like chemotaxis protein
MEVSIQSGLQMNTPQAPKQSWRILVVDDRFKFGETVRDIASLFNCNTRIALSLQSAVQHLAHWNPHLVLLDLHLPPDEWEPVPALRTKYDPTQRSLALCEQITAHPRFQHVTVCFVTVDNQREQRLLAQQAGAHGFWTKSEFGAEALEHLLCRVEAVNTPD